MKKFSSNALTSSADFICSLICTFAAYKWLIVQQGMATVGLWTLLLSIINITGVTTSGFANAVTKYIANYNADSDIDSINKSFAVCLLTSCVLIVVSLLGLYLIFLNFGTVLFNVSEIKSINDLSLVLFGALVVGIISRVLLSSLDGFSLIKNRNIASICSKLAFLIVCIWLIPKYSLLGLAIATLAQNILQAVLAIIFLKQKTTLSFNIFENFTFLFFKKVFGYGYKFQIIAFSQVGFELVTNTSLKTFGSLTEVGYFGLALNILLQLRGILIAIIYTMIPSLAGLKDANKIDVLYTRTFTLISYVATILFSILISILPVISYLFLGHLEYFFINTFFILAIAIVANLICAPAFIFNLASGNLNNNTVAFVSASVINVVLSFVLGSYLGSTGIIASWFFSSIVLASLVLFQYKTSTKGFNHLQLIRRNGLSKFLMITLFLMVAIIIMYNIAMPDFYFICSVVSFICLTLHFLFNRKTVILNFQKFKVSSRFI